MVSKEDWVAMKNSEPWKAFQEALQGAIADYSAELARRTVSNVDRDMYVRGAIFAFAEALSWEPEFVTQEGDTTNG